MIRLKPTTVNMTDDLIYQAQKIGQETLYRRKGFDRALQVDSVLLIFRSYYAEDTNIASVEILEVTGGDFVGVPRVLKRNDGYDGSQKEVGEGKITYPLNNNSSTSATITLADEIELSRDTQVFGNIDWISKNSAVGKEENNSITLTWKGPTGRTIPYDNNVQIEGLTTTDVEFEVLSQPKYTCFGPNIYSQGSVYFTAPSFKKEVVDGKEVVVNIDTPSKIIGAALTSDVEGQIPELLVFIVVNHYEGKTGFFEELYLDGKMIHSIQTGRPSMCWFFNQDGNKATQGLAEYIIDVKNKTATIEYKDNSNILMELSKTNDSYEAKYSGSAFLWSDYIGNERVFCKLIASGGHKFYSTVTSGGKMTNVDVHYTGEQPTYNPHFSCLSDGFDGTIYTLVEANPGYTMLIKDPCSDTFFPYQGGLPCNLTSTCPERDIKVEARPPEGCGNLPIVTGAIYYTNTGPTSVSITGPSIYTVPSDYTATGCELSDCQWTYPASDSCGMQEVYVGRCPVDCNGRGDKIFNIKQVKMTNGCWKVISNNTYGNVYPNNPAGYVEYVTETNGIRTTEYIREGCQLGAISENILTGLNVWYSGVCNENSEIQYGSKCDPNSGYGLITGARLTPTGCDTPQSVSYISCTKHPDTMGETVTYNWLPAWCAYLGKRIVEQWQCSPCT